MTRLESLANLRRLLTRAFLLGCCIYLSPGCTAGAYLPVTTPAPGSSTAATAEQPSSPAAPAAAPAAAAAPPAFVADFVFDPEWGEIEQVEFEVEPGVLPTATISDVLQLSRLAYGELDTSDRAFEVQLVLKNTGDKPIALNLNRQLFSFEDDQGRKAALVYFCCDAAGELLPPGQTRSLYMLFRSVPGWEGKEVSAKYMRFRVHELGPVVSASWQIRPLATAD